MADLSVNNGAQATRTAGTAATRETSAAARSAIASPDISFEDVKRAMTMQQAQISRQLDNLQSIDQTPSKIRHIRAD